MRLRKIDYIVEVNPPFKNLEFCTLHLVMGHSQHQVKGPGWARRGHAAVPKGGLADLHICHVGDPAALQGLLGSVCRSKS